MAPAVDLTICATPALPMPARAVDGHLMVELLPSVHTLGMASLRNRVKFCVVPEESERTAIGIGVLGRLTPELSGAVAGSCHLVILPWKIFATTGGLSFGFLTPVELTRCWHRPMLAELLCTIVHI